MRLIDADELPKQEIKDEKAHINPSYARGWNDAIRSVYLYAPKIDAEPVRRGHWIDTGSGQECSVCHEIQYGYDNYRYYCPYCGAQTKYVQKPLARALYQNRGAQMEEQE